MHLKLASLVADSREEYQPYMTDIVYLGGCPLRCGYCNVPDLLHTKTCEIKEVDALAAYFQHKQTQAVSIKGGEPFVQANAMIQLFRQLKGAGIKTKVETSGYFPESVRTALPWTDYLCIDVKTMLDADAYSRMTGIKGDLALMQIYKTLAFVESTEYPVFKEIRMTVVPGQNDSPDAVENVASYVRKYCDLFILQQFVPDGELVNPDYKALPETPHKSLADLAMVVRNLIPAVAVRTREGIQFVR
ncbi:radical SAM protein [Candidatus Micrarchaeota archaeon]|nr:radical SAM protein [Candidatus Micrarchaeota archaeon]